MTTQLNFLTQIKVLRSLGPVMEGRGQVDGLTLFPYPFPFSSKCISIANIMFIGKQREYPKNELVFSFPY